MSIRLEKNTLHGKVENIFLDSVKVARLGSKGTTPLFSEKFNYSLIPPANETRHLREIHLVQRPSDTLIMLMTFPGMLPLKKKTINCKEFTC